MPMCQSGKSRINVSDGNAEALEAGLTPDGQSKGRQHRPKDELHDFVSEVLMDHLRKLNLLHCKHQQQHQLLQTRKIPS